MVAASGNEEGRTSEPSNLAKGKISPGDSGVMEHHVVTEDTEGGEEIAGTDRPSTPGMMSARMN